MTVKITTPETIGNNVATQGTVAVTNHVVVEIPHVDEATTANADEIPSCSVPEPHIEVNANADTAGSHETTTNSNRTGEKVQPDAAPCAADLEPIDQRLSRLRAECIILGAEAASEQTALDNDAKAARERQSAFTDKQKRHFEATYAYGRSLQDLDPEALKSHLCELKVVRNGKSVPLTWRKDYAENPFIPLMATSNSALSGGRLSIRATSALYASKLDVPVSEVIQFVDGEHEVEEAGETVSRNGLMACYAAAKAYMNSSRTPSLDVELKKMQADLRKHTPLFQVSVDPTNFPIGFFAGMVFEMTEEGELRAYGSPLCEPAAVMSAINAVKASGFAETSPLYPLYQALEAADLVTEARYSQASHAELKDQPRYMLLVRSGEGENGNLHVAFAYQKQRPTLYCRLPNILPDLPENEVFHLLPEAQQAIRDRLKSGVAMELDVPRVTGLHFKLNGPESEAPVLFEHAANIAHPVKLVVGSKRTIWPMPLSLDTEKREHILEAYRLLKGRRKKGDSLKSPFVWVTQWDEDGFWRLSLDLKPVSITADIVKMEVKPDGEHKDREFSASHIDRFLQASKKLHFHGLHGQVFDRELVLNASWGETELSFVIPTYFPSQFEHNGREITHRHERYWEIGDLDA